MYTELFSVVGNNYKILHIFDSFDPRMHLSVNMKHPRDHLI
jgi:hypothetical protein